MAITVGLDFGTHQTKICIENSDSTYHWTYEFYEWEKGVYALPSVIQINKDHTVRYGSIDLDTCLVSRKKRQVSNPGELCLPNKPIEPLSSFPNEPQLPPQPIYTFINEDGLTTSIPYSELYGIGRPLPQNKTKSGQLKRWKKECQKIKEEYEKRKRIWVLIEGGKQGLPLPKKPVYPPRPTKKQNASSTIDKPVNPMLIASKEQIDEYKTWFNHCASLKAEYNKKVEIHRRAMTEYRKAISIWENECDRLRKKHQAQIKQYENSLIEYPLIYRYFKQATFSTYIWDYEIKAQDLTVLYLAYIIFKLEERFGTDFSIQMGVPASKNNFTRLKPLASGYLIQAIRLVEDVFQNNFDQFLKTPYEKLLSLIPPYEYSDDLKTTYGLIILPEAYASLYSLVANSHIPEGMSIMLDVGGGTTDISFFIIDDGNPHIYHFDSVAKGLNFFLEYEDRHNFKAMDFSNKKEIEDIPNYIFNLST